MDTKDAVREFYGEVASGVRQSCCAPGCCGAEPTDDFAARIGYTAEQLARIPAEANLGLGCGNPMLFASIPQGATVLDLGSGAGIDCFLAAGAVGPTGKVIGVDMTPAMLSRARETAQREDWPNVEFRLGEIEALPLADGTVDVIISNCVVNLSPDKQRVFDEAYRVLRPGGRIAISDVLAIARIPEALRNDLAALAGCIGGASHVDEVREMLERAGFVDVDVQTKPGSATLVEQWLEGASRYVTSATIEARKPTEKA